MDLGLANKIAFVTGGASGIGNAIASVFAREGATVYIGDLPDALDASSSERNIRLDVAEEKSVRDAFAQLDERAGGIDILVNSAGVLRSGPLSSSALDDWESLSAINVGGLYACSMAAVAMMAPRKYGKILNLSSISAIKGGGFIGNALYGTSKAAVSTLTKGFAREYAPFGINVNAIAPGLTDTPMIAALDEEARERIVAGVPARRLAEPTDIANLAAFLVSDLAGYINGSTVIIDGGALTL